MSTSYKGITIPEYTDAADGPAAFINAIDAGPIPRFATTSDRNAAFQAPEKGTLTYVETTQFEWWDGSSWVALSGDYALKNHTHSGADITSGTVAADYLPKATVSAYGVTKLVDSTSSTSTKLAATGKAVKAAFDKANHKHPYAPISHTHEYLPLTGGELKGVLRITQTQHSDATALRFGNMTARYGLYGNTKEFSIAMNTRRLTVWEPGAAQSRGSGILEIRGTPGCKYTFSGGDGKYSFKLTAKALNWLQRYN
jgi:hypothetical protein